MGLANWFAVLKARLVKRFLVNSKFMSKRFIHNSRRSTGFLLLLNQLDSFGRLSHTLLMLSSVLYCDRSDSGLHYLLLSTVKRSVPSERSLFLAD